MDHFAGREAAVLEPPALGAVVPDGEAPESAAVSGNGTVPPAVAAPPQWTAPPVETLLPLVYAIARTVGRTLPPVVELADLVHDGVLGLLESTRRFDPSRGVDFRTYAGYRIRGAILDGLRARDPLPRSLRRALKAAEQSRIEGATSDGIPAASHTPVTQLISLEDTGPVAESGGEPEELFLADELLYDVRQAVAALPGRDRQIIELRFTFGWRLRQIAAHYGISITRVAELQERAIRRLRAALGVPRAANLSPNGRRRRSRRR